ncbi:MAG: hypothetical protein K6F86_09120 [Lachnospiraceae bacterium]|nr:hypothetical protein [Lachnospiraceae bacterium]
MNENLKKNALSDDMLDAVSGGAEQTRQYKLVGDCPKCGKDKEVLERMGGVYLCKSCGTKVNESTVHKVAVN